MKRPAATRWAIVGGALVTALLAIAVARPAYFGSWSWDLPYHPIFIPDIEDGWTAYGGAWEVVDGSMRNESNDRGAKLVTGSPYWTDYVVAGDVQLLGHGSVGMLGRVSDAQYGENSFKGYLAGVRTADHSLFLGTYDFVYVESGRISMPEPVRPNGWYHIELRVEGCTITASAWAVGTSEVRTRSLEDPNCFESGLIGMRSNATGAIWRNVRVSPITDDGETEPHPILPAPPSYEAVELSADEPLPAKRSMRSLIYTSPLEPERVAVQGEVILTRPSVFVQDSSGGIEVHFNGPTPLKIGDEVEIAGDVSLDSFEPILLNSRYRVLREATPRAAAMVTADQLSVGSFFGTLIEVEGTVRKFDTAPDGHSVVVLESGLQAFSAILPKGRSRWHAQEIERGSRILVRGVPTAASEYNEAIDPFVILVQSAEGLSFLAGPPIWGPTLFLFVGLVVVTLIFALNQLYLVVRGWRLRAVAEERERLAHQLHDTLAQSFAGIGFQLQAVRNTIPDGNENFIRRVDLALSMAQKSHEEACRCIEELRPEVVDHTVLLPALREYAELMVANGSIRVETSGGEGGGDLPPRVRDVLFRIGKEAITNSIRHADPQRISITFRRLRDSYVLTVEDDGKGFEAGTDWAGFGVLGMRRRAKNISATVTFRSKPGHGTRVEVNVPVQPRFGFLTRFKRRNALSWRKKAWSTSES